VKLYRQIERGEVLQAGDEILSYSGTEWCRIDDDDHGKTADQYAAWYRRPVDAVPSEKLQELQAALLVTCASREVLMQEIEELRQLVRISTEAPGRLVHPLEKPAGSQRRSDQTQRR
jgi:hypothetical protein